MPQFIKKLFRLRWIYYVVQEIVEIVMTQTWNRMIWMTYRWCHIYTLTHVASINQIFWHVFIFRFYRVGWSAINFESCDYRRIFSEIFGRKHTWNITLYLVIHLTNGKMIMLQQYLIDTRSKFKLMVEIIHWKSWTRLDKELGFTSPNLFPLEISWFIWMWFLIF